MLFTKLHEFVALWSKSAAAERATGIGLSDLQTRIRILSDQIDFMPHRSRPLFQGGLLDEIADISMIMSRISDQRLYLGDQSLEQINELGDDLLARVDDLEKTIDTLAT